MHFLASGSVQMTMLKIAIVHEWLEHFAGSERVIEQLIKRYPQAKIFATVDFLPNSERDFLQGRSVETSFIQKMPFARRFFRHYLGLMPLAVEQWDLSEFDVIISSHHAVAKGVITGPDQLHVSYVHSPMRYAWDMQSSYLRQSRLERGAKSFYIRWLFHRLRNWDVRAAAGVDVFVANSNYIARRIRKVWRREAEVVFPPVDIERFQVGEGVRDEYLIVSRLVPYKRVDLVVEAFKRMPGRRLNVIGGGPDAEMIRARIGDAPNIVYHGKVSDQVLLGYMQSAKAFVFAAEEDFGIVMVEAQACGTPLIVYGRGGAVDIVRAVDDLDGPTGVLFARQSADDIVAAVERFEAEAHLMTPERCRANASRFSETVFQDHMDALIHKHHAEMFPGEGR